MTLKPKMCQKHALRQQRRSSRRRYPPSLVTRKYEVRIKGRARNPSNNLNRAQTSESRKDVIPTAHWLAAPHLARDSGPSVIYMHSTRAKPHHSSPRQWIFLYGVSRSASRLYFSSSLNGMYIIIHVYRCAEARGINENHIRNAVCGGD